jgi:hypothetical protein
MHFRPASITDHFDESSMIGTREMSGSVAISLQKLLHGRHGVEHRLVHVDVDDLGAVFHLLARHRQRVVEAAFEDHAREGLGAGDVGALADVHEQRLGADVEGLQARQAQLFLESGTARGDQATASAIAAMCAGVVPQQPPTMFTSPLCAHSMNLGGQVLGRFVVAGGRQRVGQAGVGVGRDVGVADVRQLFDVLAQLIGAQRAVEAEADRLRVAANSRRPRRSGPTACGRRRR